MENQPATTGRQWFRLASLARLEALGQPTTVAPALAPASAPSATPAGPVQAPVPRIPIPRSETMQPQPQPPRPPTPPTQQVPQPTAEATPPPSSAAESSSKAPVAQALLSTVSPSPRFGVPSRAPTPPQSPKIANPSPSTAPPESPTMRQLKPIKAPTPYPEPEQAPSPALTPKNMYVQQEINNGTGVKTIPDITGNPHANSNQSRSNARHLPPSLEKETAPPNGTEMATAMKKEEDGAIKVITMSGENMGAYMEFGSAHGQKQQHGYKLRDLTKGSESQGEDGKPEYKKRESGKKSAAKGKPTTALVSSNVQSVNNSILFRSSCAQHSPGIHMTLVSRR